MLSALWGKTPPPPVEKSPVVVETPFPAPVAEVVKEAAVIPEPEMAEEPAPLAPGEKLVLLGVKVRPDTKKTLGELASLAGVTVSTYVRTVLERVRR